MGFITGAALLIGAAIAYFFLIPQRIIDAIMAFGSGVLKSALSFKLMDEAFKTGGYDSTAIGFISGAAVFTLANWILEKQGVKRPGESPTEDVAGSILAMLVDTMIPEAFEETYTLAGLITVAGFLASFILSKMG